MNSVTRWTLDEQKEKKGVRVSIGNGEFVKIRPGGGVGNDDQAAHIDNELEKRGFDSADEAGDEITLELLIDSIANHVLLDWEGFTGKDGKEMKATLENKRMMLAERLFRNRIAKEAQDVANFRISEENKAVKN